MNRFTMENPCFSPFVCLPGALLLSLSMSLAQADVPISKTIVISCPTSGADDFKKLADFAKEIHATNVDVSDLPKDRWQWFDPADPYPNWSLMATSILKVMVPPELTPAVPTEVAGRSQKILAERGDILRKEGLKGFYHGCEPMWLPEAVYQAHPNWRGPTCQAPERSRHNYFAPDIDNPEVLALYKKATTDLCKLAPIDDFDFLTNDSGAGISWDPGLYTGANGPAYCKDRPLADRINGFMNTLRDGAKDAGLDAAVGLAKMRVVPADRPEKVSSAGIGGYFWASKVYPVLGITDPIAFAEQLDAMFAEPQNEWRISLDSLDNTAFLELIRSQFNKPAHGPLQQMEALNAVATKMVGAAHADDLVEAWQQIHEAILVLQQIDNGGPVLLLGSVNQRWLVRPLVAFPLELPDNEKAYFRRFQFQGNSEENAANLMNLQGLYAISGDAGTLLAHSIFQDTLKHLTTAHEKLKPIAENSDAVQALDERIQALILVTKNADITARYQSFLDHSRPEWRSRPDRHGNFTAEDGKKLVAEDEANTNDLITLLSSTKVPLIDVAPTAAEEDSFWLNPDLIGQLRKKIQIEQEHLPDHYRL